MRFIVDRTSIWHRDQKPCDEAEAGTAVLAVGGKDKEIKVWYVVIDSLEELIAFVKNHGQIVLNDSYFVTDEDTPHIEIYDDYRE